MVASGFLLRQIFNTVQVYTVKGNWQDKPQSVSQSKFDAWEIEKSLVD